MCTGRLVLFLLWPVAFQAANAQRPGGSSAEADRLKAQAYAAFVTARVADAPDYALTARLARQALAAAERALGQDDPGLARHLNTLAVVLTTQEQYEQAERLFARAVGIVDSGEGSSRAEIWHNYASLFQLSSDTSDTWQRKGRQIRARAEQVIQNRKPDYAAIESWVGGGPLDPIFLGPIAGAELLDFYAHQSSTGNEVRDAVKLLEQAVAIASHRLAPNDLRLSVYLQNLAGALKERGFSDRALGSYRRALSILDSAPDATADDRILTLTALGQLHQSRGELGEAETHFTRALALADRGASQESIQSAVTNLGELYLLTGSADRGEALLRRGLAIAEKDPRPYVAYHLQMLGRARQLQHDYPGAETLYRRGIASLGNLTPASELQVDGLDDLAGRYEARGETAQAVATLARALDLADAYLAKLLAYGDDQSGAYGGASEEKILSALAGAFVDFDDQFNQAISLHLRSAPTDSTAAELALTTVLRRKGRVLDGLSASQRLLRRHMSPVNRAQFDQLLAARSALSRLRLTGPAPAESAAYAARLEELGDSVKAFEEQLSRVVAQAVASTRLVSLDSIRAALPPEAALVEFVTYQPFDPRAKRLLDRWAPPRYAAYVLRRGRAPRGVDLGLADSIDATIWNWRRALASPARDAKTLGRTLYDQLVAPLDSLLGESPQLLLAPDGELNLVPFGALIDARGRYLLDRVTLSYLTSGRELAERPTAEGTGEAVILADPDFDSDSTTRADSGAAEGGRRSTDLSDAHWNRLSGTAREAEQLRSILPKALMLTERAATEEAVKGMRPPGLLHLATHGFFLAERDTEGDSTSTTRSKVIGTAKTGSASAGRFWSTVENPLLRSGIVLAGANGLRSGVEDGVLTALELAGLDLSATRLVVLSACETGLGDVRRGEGVYGLRRALVLAGSESQVISLWRVSDTATTTLMAAFYRGLASGLGRAEALRRAQLAMRDSAGGGHPFYWAAFIASGRWEALDSTVFTTSIAADSESRAAANPAGTPARSGVRETTAPRGLDHVEWTYRTGQNDMSSPIVDGQMLYVGDRAGHLHAVDRRSGARRWTFDSAFGYLSTPAAAAGLVLVAADNDSSRNALYAVDAASGALRWSFQEEGGLVGTPAIVNGIVYWGGWGKRLHAFDLATGRELWTVALGRHTRAVPTVLDGTVFVPTTEIQMVAGFPSTGAVHALDALTGREKWKLEVEGGVSGGVVSAADGFFFVSGNAELFSVDPAGGTIRWRHPLPGGRPNQASTPAVYHGMVYVGAANGLYVVDVRTGRFAWKHDLDDAREVLSPSIADSVVFIGSLGWDDNALHALDLRTGQERRLGLEEDEVVGLPVVLNGVLYFASRDGRVRAVR